MSENVVQPGVEPGSPDYRSDALTTRPLNQPRWQRGYFKALSVAGSWETLFTHFLQSGSPLYSPARSVIGPCIMCKQCLPGASH